MSEGKIVDLRLEKTRRIARDLVQAMQGKTREQRIAMFGSMLPGFPEGLAEMLVDLDVGASEKSVIATKRHRSAAAEALHLIGVTRDTGPGDGKDDK